MDARRQETPALLSRSSPEPLYRQLAGHLEREIASGAVKPGDRIESEGLLAERFKVSRITVRQAIEGLVKQQQLIRKQGKGTFVTAPPMRHDLRRPHGLFGSLFSQSDDASAKLLLYELQVPPEEIAAAMKLRPGQRALIFRRLYLIDNKPVALLQVAMAPRFYPGHVNARKCPIIDSGARGGLIDVNGTVRPFNGQELQTCIRESTGYSMGYSEAAAKDSPQRMLAFFAEHLRAK